MRRLAAAGAKSNLKNLGLDQLKVPQGSAPSLIRHSARNFASTLLSSASSAKELLTCIRTSKPAKIVSIPNTCVSIVLVSILFFDSLSAVILWYAAETDVIDDSSTSLALYSSLCLISSSVYSLNR